MFFDLLNVTYGVSVTFAFAFQQQCCFPKSLTRNNKTDNPKIGSIKSLTRIVHSFLFASLAFDLVRPIDIFYLNF